MDLSTRLEIEAHLREATERARLSYESAKQQYQCAMEHYRILGATHPDGAASLQQAIRAQTIAMEEYSRALMDFNGFILNGKRPEHLK